jgi:hypothetical protein
VSEPLYAERFFATRDRLSGLVNGILALAGEVNAPFDGQVKPVELAAELDRPLQVIACGEVNAGKSSFLNGLAGHGICPVSALPLTDQVRRYRFGEAADDPAGCSLPLDFLRRYNLIDTPGTNRGGAEDLDALARHAAEADLVFLVYAVTNPWCAATWDLLGRLPGEALTRTALIVQQADQRAPADVEVILGHMAELARQRIGRVPPVFPVSANLALDALRNGSSAGWRASGFAKLADFIDETVCQCPARRELLEIWRARTASVLGAVDDHIERQHRSLVAHNHFLDHIEGEIELLREEFVGRLPSHLVGVAEVFESEATAVSRLLHRRLRAIPSLLRLFTGTRTGAAMESGFIERLQSSIATVAERDGSEVAEACADHWQQLAPRVTAEIGVQIDDLPAIERSLAAARDRFVQNLTEAARQAIGNLRVRHQLDRDLRKRDIALRSFLVSTLLFTTAGAVCGALGLPWLPLVLCGLAAVFFLSGVLVSWLTRRRITREFRQRLLDTCGAFAATLRGDYEAALGAMFREYAACLGPLRTHLARGKLAIAPRQRRWQELFLTLKEIEQDW